MSKAEKAEKKEKEQAPVVEMGKVISFEDMRLRQTALYTVWNVEIVFIDQVHGGVPVDPKMIEGWIKAKISKGEMVMTDPEAQKLIEKTVAEVTNLEEEVEAAGCVFKGVNDPNGLYLESRQVKACFREGFVQLGMVSRDPQKRKITRDGIQHSFHVEPDRIYFGNKEPDGFEESVAHVKGPRGPRSCFKRNDYMTKARIKFTVKYLKAEEVEDGAFLDALAAMQDIGLGANRSAGKGKFSVLSVVKVG